MNKFATRKSIYGMVTAAALSLLLVGPTLAESTAVTVGPGSFSSTAPVIDTTFEGVSITNTVQTTTADLGTFQVSDLRGTGVGWNVTVNASDFAGAGGSAAGKTVDSSALTLSAPSVTPTASTTSASPALAASAPWAFGTGSVKILQATADTGMGVYNMGATTFTLSLPAELYIGTYTSTVTVDFNQAP